MTDPKNFKRRRSILILMGERAPKKRNFSVKIFQKVPKNALFGLFFQNGAENLVKMGPYSDLRELRKSVG